MPSTNARPLVGVSNVVKILMSVVFPAPLGPSSPKELSLAHFEVHVF
jgi:hypothetical protein